ncbi:MAG TPA: TonB-dependent receptor plug domain-containing protein [Phnomibacter sp.]|nr:TonB-dependent receptor plug domain-containing protein [Phnomibacter sp.]
MKDGRKLVYELNEAKKKGYFIPPPPPPPPAPAAPDQPDAPAPPQNGKQGSMITTTGTDGKSPLYIYAGQEISEAQMQQVDPNQIERIDVLKGDAALKVYGEKGRNGVVKITPKNADYSQRTSGSQVNSIATTGQPPLYYFDGIRISEEHMKMIDPSTIATVHVWKGDKAIDKFGTDAQYGVVEIISKANAEVATFVSPPSSSQSLKAKATMSSLLQSASSATARPLILLNDKEITAEEMKNLDPKSIMEIKVIKGADAFKQYGAKGMNGVIIIKEGC